MLLVHGCCSRVAVRARLIGPNPIELRVGWKGYWPHHVILTLSIVAPVGLLGVVVGAYAWVRKQRRAAKVGLFLGGLTIVVGLGVQGWGLMSAFGAVAGAPPESRQLALAEGIAAAMWSLPTTLILACLCFVLSGLAWRRTRGTDGKAAV